jgi:glucose 1-dehydrogenase
VDTVINFTGVDHSRMDFCKNDPTKLAEDFLRVMNVNTTGAFYLTLAFARKMVARPHGHIIHVCSDGSRLSLYGSYAHSASKDTAEGLIKTAALQLAPFNVRVDGVAPGAVETAHNRHLLGTEDGKNYTPRAISILGHIPTKKFATLEGISESIAAMCIPQRHFTGNVVFCDDG